MTSSAILGVLSRSRCQYGAAREEVTFDSSEGAVSVGSSFGTAESAVGSAWQPSSENAKKETVVIRRDNLCI